MWPCTLDLRQIRSNAGGTAAKQWSDVHWQYNAQFPCTRTVITANSHDMHHPEATAVLAIASRELTLIGSSCGTLSGKTGCVSSKRDYNTDAETHPAMAALAFGLYPGLFDLGTTTIDGAGGWGWVTNGTNANGRAPSPAAVSNQGLVRILDLSPPLANFTTAMMSSTIACHTLEIRGATPAVFPPHNFATAPSVVRGSSATVGKAGAHIDGRVRYNVVCGAGDDCTVELGCAVFLQ